MSPDPSFPRRLAVHLRRATSGVRGAHIVSLTAVAAAAFGLAGLRSVDLPGPSPISDGDRLRIEVVHPVEPEVVPGSVMEVGELVDGFQGVPPPPPALTEVAMPYDDGWDDYDRRYSPEPEPRRVAEVRTYDARPEPQRSSPVRTVRRWFGFDAPRRDYQAERAARRARIDAMEYAARERRDRERHAADRYAADRYADEQSRRARAEDNRYAYRRDRDDRFDEGGYDRRPWRSDRAGTPPDDAPAPPPSGPRPYYDGGR